MIKRMLFAFIIILSKWIKRENISRNSDSQLKNKPIMNMLRIQPLIVYSKMKI